MNPPESEQGALTDPVVDLKDEVTHLRTVHFSLLVACVALFGLTVAGQSNEYERALAQLDQIEDVLERWDPRWLEEVAAEQVPRERAISTETELPAPCPLACEETQLKIERLGLPVYERQLSEEGLRLRLDSSWTLLPLPQGLLELTTLRVPRETTAKNGPLWSRMAKLRRRDPQFLNPNPVQYPVAFDSLELNAPETLQDFEKTWDGLGRVSVTVTFATDVSGWVMIGRVNESADVNVVRPTDPTDPSWPVVLLRLEPIDEFMKGWWRDRTEHDLAPKFQFVGHTPWGEVSLPAEVEQRLFDAQKAFVEHYGLKWIPASFPINFPELSAVSLDLQGLSLDKLRVALVSQAKRSKKDITLFGLNVPAVFVAQWGGLIVIVVQLYFLLHLRAFRRRLCSERAAVLAPWIGVYPDLGSKGAMLISALAAPPFILGLVIARDLQSKPTLVSFVLASVLLAALSFPALQSIWRALYRHADR